MGLSLSSSQQDQIGRGEFIECFLDRIDQAWAIGENAVLNGLPVAEEFPIGVIVPIESELISASDIGIRGDGAQLGHVVQCGAGRVFRIEIGFADNVDFNKVGDYVIVGA